MSDELPDDYAQHMDDMRAALSGETTRHAAAEIAESFLGATDRATAPAQLDIFGGESTTTAPRVSAPTAAQPAPEPVVLRREREIDAIDKLGRAVPFGSPDAIRIRYRTVVWEEPPTLPPDPQQGSQLTLFEGGRAAHVFAEYETIVTTTHVKVRLRVLVDPDSDTDVASIPAGPLTYSECSEWLLPCHLYQCRYRLSDDVEQRTRYDLDDEDRAVGVPARGHGWWCALQVVEHEGALPAKQLAAMMGTTVNKLDAEVTAASRAAGVADSEMDDALPDHYGERGRMHGFVFAEIDDDVTGGEAKRAKVPGEEKCACEVPSGHKGKRCSACGLMIKMGRTALRVVGPRRKKGDQWEGIPRRVPEVFVRADGTEIKTVIRTKVVNGVEVVDASLLEPARAPELRTASTAEIKAKPQPLFTQYDMATLLKARGKQAA
jgi:hypothetical protein